MLRKKEYFYPEEEIIDGFSILCFDKYRSLEKFSNYVKTNVRKTVMNVLPKYHESKTEAILSKNKKPRKTPFISKALLEPTRITAKRKSKPDISILSLSSCKKKRLAPCYIEKQSNLHIKDTTVGPVIIDVDQNVTDSNDRDFESLENEPDCTTVKEECNVISAKFELLENDFEFCQMPVSEDFSENSLKDFSPVGDNFLSANSSSSPLSIQLRQLDSESIGPRTPGKIDLMSNNDTKTTYNCDLDSEFSINVEEKEKNNSAVIDEENDDCVILSVGFDSNPKLSHIPIPTCPTVVPDVPQLKPAPPIFFSLSTLTASLKSVVMPSKHVKSKPPPLTPAPARYFTIFRHDNNSTNHKSHDQNLDTYHINNQCRKRCQMKSLSLKTSPKYMKLYQAIAPTKAIANQQLPLNSDRTPLIPMLTNNYLSNSSPYSMPTNPPRPKTYISNTMKPSPLMSLKSLLPNTFKKRIPKPIPMYITNTNQATKSLDGLTEHLIRRTICHVHIAESIHKKLNIDNFMANNFVSNFSCLTKPQPLKPTAHEININLPLSHFTVPSNRDITELPFNNRLLHSFDYSLKLPKPFYSARDQNALNLPLNKSYHYSNPLSSHYSNPINMYPKENTALLNK